MFKKFFLFLSVLSLLLSAGAVFAEELPLLETPAPARVHEAPDPTSEPPVLLNLVNEPDALDRVRFRMDAKFLHVWFPNIMNADEALLVYDGQSWLIDCGDEKSGARGVELMNRLGVRKVDKLFNSHPHHDHLNGFADTIASVPVDELLICFPPDVNEHMINAVSLAEEAYTAITEFADGDVFVMGDGKVSLKCFCINDPELDMNNNSAVMLLQYGNRRMLFTADMERLGQAVLVSRVPPEELRADILKYPHHGRSGLLDEFMQAVSPSFAIITNGVVRWGGIEYLLFRRIPYLFTNPTEVYLHCYTDGNVWVVEYVPIEKTNPEMIRN